jgi:hypothetical protein
VVVRHVLGDMLPVLDSSCNGDFKRSEWSFSSLFVEMGYALHRVLSGRSSIFLGFQRGAYMPCNRLMVGSWKLCHKLLVVQLGNLV